MEENEKNRLENLKELKEKINKSNVRQTKFKKIFLILILSLVVAAIIYFIMLYSGIINTEESIFRKEFEIIYDTVKQEKIKKENNPYYEYLGVQALEREAVYYNQYMEIENIFNIKINEDFYIINNYNKEKLDLKDNLSGIYLINYDKLLIFNLNPYINENNKTYILPEILEEYNSNKDIDTSGANEPLLLKGMTPVKYNETLGKWEITTSDDSHWYNYENKEWANVVLSDYNNEDISNASMFVWIPRYAYKISPNNYNKNTSGIIAIKFLQGNTNYDISGQLINSQNTKSEADYVIHPAFNIDKQLTGIWVSKYEASSLEYGTTGENNGGDDNSQLTYKSVADAYSWTNLKVDTSYVVSKNLVNNPIYGLDKDKADSYLMKNTQWGAVAYLTQSKYGRNNNKVTINNYYDKEKLKTGYGAINNNSDYGNTENITALWNTKEGMKASTTGNVYGIYDLVGGAVERTASYLDNNAITLKNEAISLYKAEEKYKDVYSVSENDERVENYNLSSRIYGDAVYETSSSGEKDNSWYKTNSFMTTGLYTFFYRGGSVIDAGNASLFYFSSSSGGVYKYAGFRAVLTEK